MTPPAEHAIVKDKLAGALVELERTKIQLQEKTSLIQDTLQVSVCAVLQACHRDRSRCQLYRDAACF